jgi:hypothetical protein
MADWKDLRDSSLLKAKASITPWSNRVWASGEVVQMA